MVIDNDIQMQDLFNFVLVGEGWEVRTYDYDHIDLEVVQEFKPDLLLLDLNLIQQGVGWYFLQILKMEDVTAAIPVVICTTASDLTFEIEGYLAARRISIVRKPFDIDALILTIRESFVPDRVLPILLVEDNEDLADTVMTLLGFANYRAEAVGNGLLALNAVAIAQYSLILLDIALPVMNGLEFLAAYVQQPAPHSPVIIVSAQSDMVAEHLPECVVGILRKPYEISQLMTLVSQYAQPDMGKVARR